MLKQKYLIYFLLALLLLQTSEAQLRLNITQEYGPNQKFQGNIVIPPATYPQNAIITLTTEDDSTRIALSNIVDCSTQPCTRPKAYTISATSAPRQTVTGSSFLVGIQLARYSSMDDDPEFYISNSDSANLPDTPIIDIGNDNIIEWKYNGFSIGEKYAINDPNTPQFIGPSPETNPYDQEVQLINGCQLLNLQKATNYTIRAYLKTTTTNPAPEVYIPRKTSYSQSCNPVSSSFNWVECEIHFTQPLDPGSYNVCLTGAQNQNILIAKNTSDLEPKGSTQCFPNCNPINGNYLIQARPYQFQSRLNSREKYTEANTPEKIGVSLKTSLCSELKDPTSTCKCQEELCFIPINISSLNQGLIKVDSLSYKELTRSSFTSQVTEIINRQHFVTDLQASGEKITLNQPFIFNLTDFDIKTPSRSGSYKLTLNFNNIDIEQNYTVAPIPTAIINASATEANLLDVITFDASRSSSPRNLTLTFDWDFGDNEIARGKTVTHSYSSSGRYTVKLIAIDSENRRSIPSSLEVEISSSLGEIEALVRDTRLKINNAKTSFDGSSPEVKEIYTLLNLDNELNLADSRLLSHETRLESTPTEQALRETKTDIQNFIPKVPRSLRVPASITLEPILTLEDIESLYPSESTSYKQTLLQINNNINKELTASLVTIRYLSGAEESFILIKTQISTDRTPLNRYSLMQDIPRSLATTSNIIAITEMPEKLDSALKYRFSSLLPQDTQTIYYKINSLNINQVPLIKTIILPEEVSPALIPFDCPNRICNPGEDYISCPEDCPKPERKYPVKIIILSISTAIIIALIILRNKISVFNKLINRLIKIFKKEKVKLTEKQLEKLISYIKLSKSRGLEENVIKSALLRKGWQKSQIEIAFKKIRKEENL